MRTFILILVTFISREIIAQVPDWSVDPSGYSNSMVVVGVVNINYQDSEDENDRIAAFVGEELRGVASVSYFPAAERHLAFLVIYSNTAGEEVTFKAYDASTESVVDIVYLVEFEVDGLVGDGSDPFILADKIILSTPTKNDILVYPTIVTDNFLISTQALNPYNFSLLDIYGRVLMTEWVSTNSKEVILTDLPSGNYILKLSLENSSKTIRLVKQ